MYLHFICANQVRATVPFDGAPLYKFASVKSLDENFFEIIKSLLANIDPKNLEDLLDVVDVTYGGAVSNPDTLPVERYNEQSITMYGKWKPTPLTAGYAAFALIEQLKSLTSELIVIEVTLEKGPGEKGPGEKGGGDDGTSHIEDEETADTEEAAYPDTVSNELAAAYVKADIKPICAPLEQTLSAAANVLLGGEGDLSLLTSGKLSNAIKDRLGWLKDIKQSTSAYYSVLEETGECLSQLATNMKTYLG